MALTPAEKAYCRERGLSGSQFRKQQRRSAAREGRRRLRATGSKSAPRAAAQGGRGLRRSRGRDRGGQEDCASSVHGYAFDFEAGCGDGLLHPCDGTLYLSRAEGSGEPPVWNTTPDREHPGHCAANLYRRTGESVAWCLEVVHLPTGRACVYERPAEANGSPPGAYSLRSGSCPDCPDGIIVSAVKLEGPPPPRTLHVAITAWKRPDLLDRTLASFRRHNFGTQCRLWAGVDGGYDPDVPLVLAHWGVERCVVHTEHEGCARLTDHLLYAIAQQAGERDAVLLLQDDWESVRPLPVRLIWAALDMPDVAIVRLFGRYREVGGKYRTSDTRRTRTGAPTARPIRWERRTIAGEDVLAGHAYWSFPPTIGRPATMVGLTRGQRRERRCMGLTVPGRTVWQPRDPVFWHIGRPSSFAIGGKR